MRFQVVITSTLWHGYCLVQWSGRERQRTSMENVQAGKKRRMHENLKLQARAGTKAAIIVTRGSPLKEKFTLCN